MIKELSFDDIINATTTTGKPEFVIGQMLERTRQKINEVIDELNKKEAFLAKEMN